MTDEPGLWIDHPITREGATRRSFVTHYCGLRDAPRYFRISDCAVKVSVGPDIAVASRHYALRPAV